MSKYYPNQFWLFNEDLKSLKPKKKKLTALQIIMKDDRVSRKKHQEVK